MEKYYRVSDVNAIVEKLLREPYYQHDGESWYSGISAMADALLLVTPTFVDEPKQATRGLHLGHQYYCSNCGELTYMHNYCASCGAKVIKE